MPGIKGIGGRKEEGREGSKGWAIKQGSLRTTGVFLDGEFWEVEPTSDLSYTSQTTGLLTHCLCVCLWWRVVTVCQGRLFQQQDKSMTRAVSQCSQQLSSSCASDFWEIRMMVLATQPLRTSGWLHCQSNGVFPSASNTKSRKSNVITIFLTWVSSVSCLLLLLAIYHFLEGCIYLSGVLFQMHLVTEFKGYMIFEGIIKSTFLTLKP